jgi:MoaA/NifB/PqqE/SkfB family radical SAM enzyme
MRLTRKRVRRGALAVHRRFREWWMIAKAVVSTSHPVMAHIIPIRRCNLSCGYCNEYDDFSKPVPVAEMERRIAHLGKLGTTVITFSGGEPLLHPELDHLISCVRRTGALACLITNGYLLTKERIERLNAAGLEHLQISIDNAQPDDVSMKSLKVLDKKLELLAEHAEFHVNINSVVGSGIKHPEDALAVAKRSLGLGLTSTVGIIHDGSGQLRPLQDKERAIFDEIRQMKKRNFSRFNDFQENISRGLPNEWRCRAGSRYIYICEDGLVHYCSQQRGFPGVKLTDYTKQDLRREFFTQKGCAPLCTVSCVQQVAILDNWRRAPQNIPDTRGGSSSSHSEPLVQLGTQLRA